ncbi:sulfotransferase family protein [Dyella sp.]|uniref:sulfotransferase family protein n=1 Tax=Dyella sp. TaxID=1869338 RepID=UPI003F7F80F4
MRRIFIVGCPRSGTTIVQAMLARHQQVFTLPETALFEQLYGDLAWRWGDYGITRRTRRSVQMGFARRAGRHALAQLARQLGFVRTAAPWRLQTCVDRFVSMLDQATMSAGRELWIEKTPNHLLYLSEITCHIPEARFVHVIRSGMDVLASIADANLRFDDNHGFGGGTKLWANRWNRAVEIHGRYADHPRHHFIFLDDFIQDAASAWSRLCNALGLDPCMPLDTACTQPIADLTEEPWKERAVKGRPELPRSKANALFGPRLHAWLEQRLVTLEPLRNRCLAAATTHPDVLLPDMLLRSAAGEQPRA